MQVPEFTEKAILLLVGAAATGLITGIGFLLKRRFARHASDEVETFIAHHERLLAAQAHSPQPPTSQEQVRLDKAIHELHPGLDFQNMLNLVEPELCQAEIGMRAAQDADAALLAV